MTDVKGSVMCVAIMHQCERMAHAANQAALDLGWVTDVATHELFDVFVDKRVDITGVMDVHTARDTAVRRAMTLAMKAACTDPWLADFRDDGDMWNVPTRAPTAFKSTITLFSDENTDGMSLNEIAAMVIGGTAHITAHEWVQTPRATVPADPSWKSSSPEAKLWLAQEDVVKEAEGGGLRLYNVTAEVYDVVYTQIQASSEAAALKEAQEDDITSWESCGGTFRAIPGSFQVTSVDDDDDGGWRQESAMQAGMAHGTQGYNEVMGYDMDDPEY